MAPPMLSSDSATGLRAWESMQAGGPWNSIVEPSSSDISLDASASITWWSPGQYLAPGLMGALTPSLASALILTALFAALASVAGVYRLVRVLGGPPSAAALAAFATACNWHTLHHLAVYIGGESLLGAIAPWTLVAAVQPRFQAWRGVTVLFFCFLAGLLAKHSFVLVIATVCL